MIKEFDLIVVGAGPGGLMGALHAPFPRICVLEGEDQPGKKLLLTGKGQCNLSRTGEIEDFFMAFGDNGKFLRASLYAYPNTHLFSFFEERGCPLLVREDGKVFPSSLNARDVLNLLLKECRCKGVELFCRREVTSIVPGEHGFTCTAGEDSFLAPFLLLATGGFTYPRTGSRGQGFRLAASLGHSIVPPKPALAPLFVSPFPFSSCSGISFEPGEMEIYREGKKIRSLQDALLITHKGFSGPLVLHMSRFLEPGDQVKINFLPSFNSRKLEEFLLGAGGKKTLVNVLSTLLPKGFARALVAAGRLFPELTMAGLSRENRKLVASLVCSYTPSSFTVGSGGMVTAGGVSLKEINPKTMESRLHKGLFFAGEVMDIDGDTGGFNLQAAFSTGVLAGRSMQSQGN